MHAEFPWRGTWAIYCVGCWAGDEVGYLVAQNAAKRYSEILVFREVACNRNLRVAVLVRISEAPCILPHKLGDRIPLRECGGGRKPKLLTHHHTCPAPEETCSRWSATAQLARDCAVVARGTRPQRAPRKGTSTNICSSGQQGTTGMPLQKECAKTPRWLSGK